MNTARKHMCLFARKAVTIFCSRDGSVVAAHPVKDITSSRTRDKAPAVVPGEHAYHRTIVVVFCMTFALQIQTSKVSVPVLLSLMHQGQYSATCNSERD